MFMKKEELLKILQMETRAVINDYLTELLNRKIEKKKRIIRFGQLVLESNIPGALVGFALSTLFQ